MDTLLDAQRLQLFETLKRLDEEDRPARAGRVEWLSKHEPTAPSVMMGRSETVQLLREVRAVFVDGHFVATLLLAMSFVEHAIVEELHLLGHVKRSPKFSKLLEVAVEKKAFPADWLARAQLLSHRRNPFAHLKEPSHEHCLGRRARHEKRPLQQMMEEDAKDALDLAYNFFVATLNEIGTERGKAAPYSSGEPPS